MLVDFTELSPSSRIWIFSSNKDFDAIKDSLQKDISEFIDIWTAHNNELKASFKIEFNRFIIVSVDENLSSASGCSIDKLFNKIKSFEEKYNLSLLDSKLISFLDNQKIKQIPFEKLNSEITKTTFEESNPIFFNNLVKNLEDWQTNWMKKSSEGWVNKYLN